MRKVILESPYAGQSKHHSISRLERARNIIYARMAVRNAIHFGDAPIASHLLYTQPGILRDHDAGERQLGIDCGLAWGLVAEATVVYQDLGISSGMQHGIDRAIREGRPVEYRSLPEPMMAGLNHDDLFGAW